MEKQIVTDLMGKELPKNFKLSKILLSKETSQYLLYYLFEKYPDYYRSNHSIMSEKHLFDDIREYMKLMNPVLSENELILLTHWTLYQSRNIKAVSKGIVQHQTDKTVQLENERNSEFYNKILPKFAVKNGFSNTETGSQLEANAKRNFFGLSKNLWHYDPIELKNELERLGYTKIWEEGVDIETFPLKGTKKLRNNTLQSYNPRAEEMERRRKQQRKLEESLLIEQRQKDQIADEEAQKKAKELEEEQKKEKEKLQKEIDALFNALADEEDW